MPNSLLIDAGGGWFDAGSVPLAGVFYEPAFTLRYDGTACNLSSGQRKEPLADNPLRLIEERSAEGYTALGYISYDYFRQLCQMPSVGVPVPELPLVHFNFYRESDFRIAPCEQVLAQMTPRQNGTRRLPRPNMKREAFLRKVEAIKREIFEGNVYQVNLSRRFRFDPLGDVMHWFADFYRAQPVPFAALIKYDDFEIVSGSMELFLRRRGDSISTKPIKGTIRTDPDALIDAELAENLRQSPKERAENLMIVDLMRNDLGRICTSVKAKDLFMIKRYSTLYHMESEIQGCLQPGIGLSEIIAGTFPPGSVTGAPKRAALQIIDNLEPHQRGPYCGAICLIRPNGDFVMSVAIRTGIIRPTGADFFFGSGIVWDSHAETEYAETELKAKALMSTISGSGR